jgi:hypothetical protein
MSLNDVELSHFAVGEWYKDTLLASPDAPPANPRPAQAPPSTAVSAPPTPLQPQAAAPPQPTAPPPVQAPQPAAPAPPGYKFLGNNRRQITIVVNAPGSAFLPDDQLSFLTKILEACRMNIGDVAIVNAATLPVSVAELRQQLKPASILLFGLEPTAIKLPINFPVFRLQTYDDCTYLAAPSLHLLVQLTEESKLLKSKLWVSLKTLFNV